MKTRGINIFDYLKLRLGKGNSIKFWDDDWYQGGILKDICPRMYALETRKDVTVSEKMKDSSVSFSFRRGIRGVVNKTSSTFWKRSLIRLHWVLWRIDGFGV